MGLELKQRLRAASASPRASSGLSLVSQVTGQEEAQRGSLLKARHRQDRVEPELGSFASQARTLSIISLEATRLPKVFPFTNTLLTSPSS